MACLDERHSIGSLLCLRRAVSQIGKTPLRCELGPGCGDPPGCRRRSHRTAARSSTRRPAALPRGANASIPAEKQQSAPYFRTEVFNRFKGKSYYWKQTSKQHKLIDERYTDILLQGTAEKPCPLPLPC